MEQPGPVCKVIALLAYATRHVVQIKDHEAGAVGLVARKTNAVAASRVGDIDSIGSNVNLVGRSVDVAVLGCGALVNVVDIAMGRIGVREEGEHVEEVTACGIVILESVASYTEANEKSEKECVECHCG
ncbi:hypothetical protein LTR97_008155 [Elasticomyces elasticus]|uniref:Uncharacterized protein n=1 Tax=Elasticomyces elasticus TaxID=574655 RepID=A0AAN7W2U5_9PEZI|nr:hypothetical protein LTR97_008155 [Elasticomyces elasticus]